MIDMAMEEAALRAGLARWGRSLFERRFTVGSSGQHIRAARGRLSMHAHEFVPRFPGGRTAHEARSVRSSCRRRRADQGAMAWQLGSPWTGICRWPPFPRPKGRGRFTGPRKGVGASFIQYDIESSVWKGNAASPTFKLGDQKSDQ
jgi:hypothetical protein